MRLKVASEQPLTRQKEEDECSRDPRPEGGAVKCKVGLTENRKIELRQKTKQEKPQLCFRCSSQLRFKLSAAAKH